jgi:hypothetical protein
MRKNRLRLKLNPRRKYKPKLRLKFKLSPKLLSMMVPETNKHSPKVETSKLSLMKSQFSEAEEVAREAAEEAKAEVKAVANTEATEVMVKKDHIDQELKVPKVKKVPTEAEVKEENPDHPELREKKAHTEEAEVSIEVVESPENQEPKEKEAHTEETEEAEENPELKVKKALIEAEENTEAEVKDTLETVKTRLTLMKLKSTNHSSKTLAQGNTKDTLEQPDPLTLMRERVEPEEAEKLLRADMARETGETLKEKQELSPTSMLKEPPKSHPQEPRSKERKPLMLPLLMPPLLKKLKVKKKKPSP